MFTTIFAPANVHMLEIAGLCDAFFEASSKLEAGQPYRVRLVTENGEAIRCASGISVMPDASIADATEPSDTLIVVGPNGVPQVPNEKVARWLSEQASQARRYGSVCTGAFVLAGAGLLADRRVTTHWQYARRLAEEYPDLKVEPDRIFIRDGKVFSSAGVAAAIDLAFSLIEEDHGRALALWVARRLVVFLKRPGGQSQFSAALTAQSTTADPTDKVRLHILENFGGDLSLEALAKVAGTSPRNLSRLMRERLGMSVAAYVELARLDVARRMLEESVAPLKTVAHKSGFGSITTLRRAFLRNIGVNSRAYRARFRTTAPTDPDRDKADTSLS